MNVTLVYDNDAHDKLLKIIFSEIKTDMDRNRLPRIELDILKKIGWSGCNAQVFTQGFFEMYRDIGGRYVEYTKNETALIKDVLSGYCLTFSEETMKDELEEEDDDEDELEELDFEEDEDEEDEDYDYDDDEDLGDEEEDDE